MVFARNLILAPAIFTYILSAIGIVFSYVTVTIMTCVIFYFYLSICLTY